MNISLDDLTTTTLPLEEITAFPTIVPKRLGFCSNPTSSRDFCGRAVYDNDYEAFEFAPRKRVCGQCADRLLTIARKREEPDGRSRLGGKQPWKNSRAHGPMLPGSRRREAR